MILTFKIKFLE